MEQSKLDRINAFTAIARTRELTEEEQRERAELRREYIEEWKRSTVAVLENTWIQTPDGVKHKLKKKDA